MLIFEGPTENRQGELGSLSKYCYYYYCYYYSSSGSDASPSGSEPGSRLASGPVLGSGSSEIEKYYNQWVVCFAPSKQETGNSAKKAMLETNKEKYKQK